MTVDIPIQSTEEARRAVETAPASEPVPAPAASQLHDPNAVKHMDLLADVELLITVELGRTRRTIRELLALRPGSVLELDSAAGSPVDLLVNGRLLAHGEVVVVDEQFGVRITEIVGIEAVT